MKLKSIIAALMISTAGVFPQSFANSNAGSTLWICATPQNTALNRAQYEALAWVQIGAIGSHGEAGVATNILTYDQWDTDVVDKAKGMSNAGDPELEVSRTPTDPGQVLLRAAAQTNLKYAFKMIRNDPITVSTQPTVIYNRGLVVGPKRPFGRNEDFDLEVFQLALVQKEVVVDPLSPGNPPNNTVIPTITGTAKVGVVLTASNGTWTGDATITFSYMWFAGGAQIAGATASTFTPTAAELGKIIQVRVAAVNGAGSGIASSTATAAVIP